MLAAAQRVDLQLQAVRTRICESMLWEGVAGGVAVLDDQQT